MQKATEEEDETAGPTAVRTMGIRDGGWTRRGVIRRGKKKVRAGKRQTIWSHKEESLCEIRTYIETGYLLGELA